MRKQVFIFLQFLKFIPAAAAAGCILLPEPACAIQLHLTSEGIITHQMGHLFFMISMVVLIFTLSGKGLNRQKGWRFIQYSAFLFIFWNIDAILAHFLDNQLHIVKMENLSLDRIRIMVHNDSSSLLQIYYALKLDHLLCVPAMLLFFMGLSRLVDDQRENAAGKETP
ncbi:MAG: hypothetical protein ABIK15_09375 [Pseudomonadota bacterium]